MACCILCFTPLPFWRQHQWKLCNDVHCYDFHWNCFTSYLLCQFHSVDSCIFSTPAKRLWYFSFTKGKCLIHILHCFLVNAYLCDFMLIKAGCDSFVMEDFTTAVMVILWPPSMTSQRWCSGHTHIKLECRFHLWISRYLIRH